MNWDLIYWCGIIFICVCYIIVIYVSIHINKNKKKGCSMERATELEYLKWFVQSTDFGPGDSDVTDQMKRDFIQETGKNIPKGWNFFSDGETLTDITGE